MHNNSLIYIYPWPYYSTKCASLHSIHTNSILPSHLYMFVFRAHNAPVEMAPIYHTHGLLVQLRDGSSKALNVQLNSFMFLQEDLCLGLVLAIVLAGHKRLAVNHPRFSFLGFCIVLCRGEGRGGGKVEKVG